MINNFDVLKVLCFENKLRVSDLVIRTALSKTSVNRSLKELINAKLVLFEEVYSGSRPFKTYSLTALGQYFIIIIIKDDVRFSKIKMKNNFLVLNVLNDGDSCFNDIVLKTGLLKGVVERTLKDLVLNKFVDYYMNKNAKASFKVYSINKSGIDVLNNLVKINHFLDFLLFTNK